MIFINPKANRIEVRQMHYDRSLDFANITPQTKILLATNSYLTLSPLKEHLRINEFNKSYNFFMHLKQYQYCTYYKIRQEKTHLISFCFLSAWAAPNLQVLGRDSSITTISHEFGLFYFKICYAAACSVHLVTIKNLDVSLVIDAICFKAPIWCSTLWTMMSPTQSTSLSSVTFWHTNQHGQDWRHI